MIGAERFPFTAKDVSYGDASLRPYFPLLLQHTGRTKDASGLIDSGSAINVLPYDIGLELGFDWHSQTVSLRLTGNLADAEARAIFLEGTVGRFPPVRLAFAWTRAEGVPMLLGHINFLLEFDVCLFRTQSFFEVKPASSS